MALGKQIKKYRQFHGWTMEHLSVISDVDIGTIGALEKRDSKRSEKAPALAKALGLTVEQLLDETTDWSPVAAVNVITAEVDARQSPHSVMEPRPAAVPAPIPLPRPASPLNGWDALRCLRDLLLPKLPGARSAVVALMGDLADHADDHLVSENTIQQIMLILGQGNEPARASTNSPHRESTGK